MTQERFLKLLDNPDLLASISYEELKTLALAYPYAHNLRYLLAIKARQDNHPDFARNLASAAAYSLNRARLFALVAPQGLAPRPVVSEIEELVLELKPIETVQRELQAKVPLPRTTETPAQTAVSEQQVKPGPATNDQTIGAGAQAEVPIDLSSMFEQKLEDIQQEVPAAPVVREEITLPAEIKPAAVPPVTVMPSFGIWASQFNPPILAEEKVPVPEKLPGTAKPKPAPTTTPEPSADSPGADTPAITAQMLAEKSVTENKDILSETLAKLYARQGYREKAITMYQRLSLAFPDKSAYFAAEIEKLKK